MNTLTVGGGCTVTLRVAVAVRPPPSCTVTVSVCAPSATVAAVSQLKVNVPAGPLLLKRTTVPLGGRRGSSTLTFNKSVPLPPLVVTDTLTTPPTVAPSAGVLNITEGGGGMVTVTLRVAVAGGPPLPSCTVSVSVWEPVATLDVSHVNDAVGPVFEVEKIGGEPPSSCSVQLIVPVPFSSQLVNHPLRPAVMVVSSVPGWVMKGVVGPDCTVTLRVAVAVRPPPSCTVRSSRWAPAVTVEVSQVNDAVGPAFEVEKIGAAPPSSRTVQLIVPVPLFSLSPTGTGPPTVAPS